MTDVDAFRKLLLGLTAANNDVRNDAEVSATVQYILRRLYTKNASNYFLYY